MKKLRILLADNHAILRQGLRMVINTQPDMEVVGEASDGQEAVQQTLQLRPDVVLMDISMHKVNGYEATLEIKKLLPETKILALTRHDDSSYAQQLLRAGASGYALKQSDSRELLRAIRTIVEAGTYLDPAIAGKLVGTLLGRASKRDVAKAGTLSEREAAVLRLIARGYSNKEVAEQFQLSVKTVETHKANAMLKLELKNRVDIVRYALLCGWLQDK
jgi:two-component system, NarL family, response regulator NreC